MTDIPAALTEIHSALVDKMGQQPSVAPSMWIAQSGKYRIDLYPPRKYQSFYTAAATNAEDCIADALAHIAKMPTAEEAEKREWHNDLGKVIDKGHQLALPDDVMGPLRQSSQAMSKNLLSAPNAEDA